MSGSYPDTSVAAVAASEVEANMALTVTRVALSQAEARHFIEANGAAVVAGHGQIGEVPPSLAGTV